MSKFEKKIGKPKPKDKLIKDRPIPGKKKPKKDKRTWEEKYFACPFCGAMIPEVPQPLGQRSLWMYRESVCPNCKAFEVEDGCPSCHRTTWFKPDDKTLTTGEYAHYVQRFNCGFRGRRLMEGKVAWGRAVREQA